MRQRRDKAQALAGLCQPHIAGGAAGLIGQIMQRVFGRQTGAQIFQWPVLIKTRYIAHLAHRHHFDKGQIVVLGCAPIGQAEQLILIEAFQGHGVDLYAQPRLGGRLNAVQHLIQPPPAGDLREFGRIKRIKRHIDAFHAAGREIGGIFAQLRSVGGQRQFLQRPSAQMP